jgi:hypothetical protein
MIYSQELQGEWPKLRGYLTELSDQVADNALEAHGNDSAKLYDGAQQNADDSHGAIEKSASDLTSQGPWVFAEAPRAFDGPAVLESARART